MGAQGAPLSPAASWVAETCGPHSEPPRAIFGPEGRSVTHTR